MTRTICRYLNATCGANADASVFFLLLNYHSLWPTLGLAPAPLPPPRSPPMAPSRAQVGSFQKVLWGHIILIVSSCFLFFLTFLGLLLGPRMATHTQRAPSQVPRGLSGPLPGHPCGPSRTRFQPLPLLLSNYQLYTVESR
jgi:hypothetical protein